MVDMVEDDRPIDAAAQKWGPGFLHLNSVVYRLEMLLVTFAILGILFYWRLFVVQDLNLYTVAFWLVWPDLASLIPIGLAARGSRNWPRWGPSLYNFFHTFLVIIPLFAIWSLITGTVQWPLLGWVGHITTDRAVGYYLRARPAK
jgi:hypothetical protein